MLNMTFVFVLFIICGVLIRAGMCCAVSDLLLLAYNVDCLNLLCVFHL